MAEKHEKTPVVAGEDVRTLVGGAMLFKLPAPAHLIVVDLEKLPCAEQFPIVRRTFMWAPQDMEVYADHAHEEAELFVGFFGRILFELSDGLGNSVEVVLERGHALFIPPWVWHRVQIQQDGAVMWVHCETSYDRPGTYQLDWEIYCAEARARAAGDPP